MSVKRIIPSIESNNSAKNKIKNNLPQAHSNVSFQGAGFVVPIMDAVDRGGFAGSFILQDFLGMAAPRVITGTFRNHDKTGKYNWDFAKREGIREILSGPSAFIIPAGMIWGIKRLFGSANNVPIDFIKNFSETFSEYAAMDKNALTLPHARQNVYKEMFKNLLSTSLEGKLQGEELERVASDYAQRLEVISDKTLSPKKSMWKSLAGKADPLSRQDKTAALIDDFVNLRKKHLGLDVNAFSSSYKVGSKEASASMKSVLSYMQDYANDALKSAQKTLRKSADADMVHFFKKFSLSRSGSRFLSNLSMYSAVVLMFTVIPKLYNSVVKGSRDPGLDGLEVSNNQKPSSNPTFGTPNVNDNPVESKDSVKEDKPTEAAQPSFTGLGSAAMSKVGKTLEKYPGFKSKISDLLEFDGASMKPWAMFTMLFGFCLPPRIKNSKSKYDLKEIFVRDITSFLAILFAGKALSRAFSKMLSKKSGFVLTKNAGDNVTFLQKFRNYFGLNGMAIFDSPQIVSKYSGLRNVKDGFNGFIEFINKNNGNIKKVLGNVDESVAKACEKILGKPVKDASVEEITRAFKNASATHPEEMEAIYKAFDTKNNKFVNRAKEMNSSFNLISNLLLVPYFMYWLARHCEKMTKKAVARDLEKQENSKVKIYQASNFVPSSKPSMAGFLNKKSA